MPTINSLLVMVENVNLLFSCLSLLSSRRGGCGSGW